LINSLPHFYVSFPDFYLLCSAKQRLLYKETSGMKLKWWRWDIAMHSVA
jgi:hypothetical protein